QFDGNLVGGEFAAGFLDGQMDEIADITGSEARYDTAGFEPGDVEDLADEPIEAVGGLVDLGDHGALIGGGVVLLEIGEMAGGILDDGDGRANLVRHGVEKGFAEALGFGEETGLLRKLAQPMLVEGHGDLLRAGVQETALVRGGRSGLAESKPEHTDYAATAGERRVKGLGGTEARAKTAGGFAAFKD